MVLYYYTGATWYLLNPFGLASSFAPSRGSELYYHTTILGTHGIYATPLGSQGLVWPKGVGVGHPSLYLFRAKIRRENLELDLTERIKPNHILGQSGPPKRPSACDKLNFFSLS